MGPRILVEWEGLLDRFTEAPEALLNSRELLRRAESKFVVPVGAAPALLQALTRDYALLAAGAAKVATYHTLYFDTKDLDLFHAQRRGRRVRHKVRIRHYPDRSLSFLEVKTRVNENETSKVRRNRVYGSNALTREDIDFVRARTALRDDVLPQAWTSFRRVTLLGAKSDERVTFDFDFSVASGALGDRLPNVAIVEVKQRRLHRWSPVMRALRDAGLREGWASKYCVGIALAYPDVRANRLLIGLRALKAVAA